MTRAAADGTITAARISTFSWASGATSTASTVIPVSSHQYDRHADRIAASTMPR
ncbi:hypothetical protein [Amycolatopsis thermoflava]|uniref:hypothetical protein n=1 Tax=Amycolatopsis thermoflava TaxID=84480 RepID=UPI0036586954